MEMTNGSQDQIRKLFEAGDTLTKQSLLLNPDFRLVSPLKPAYGFRRMMVDCVLETDSLRVAVSRQVLEQLEFDIVNYSIRPNPKLIPSDGDYLLVPTRDLWVSYRRDRDQFRAIGSSKTDRMDLATGTKSVLPDSAVVFASNLIQAAFKAIDNVTSGRIERQIGSYETQGLPEIAYQQHLDLLEKGKFVPISLYDLSHTPYLSLPKRPILPSAV